jgi:hypothetical protein
MSSREYQKLPDQGTKVGRELQGNGICKGERESLRISLRIFLPILPPIIE